MSLLTSLADKDGFRPRGTHMTRVDAFSDVVFGFAITLLVVSLEVPKTYTELHAMLTGFLPFAICFLMFTMVWLDHYRFFRRFGLHDPATIRLNAALLFVVLFYVYPLKFLFSMLVGEILRTQKIDPFTSAYQVRELMVIYGLGFAAIYGLISLLNYQGWLQRNALELNPLERLLTRSYIIDSATVACIGLLSCAIAYIVPVANAGLAGFTYMLISVQKPIHFSYFGKKVRTLQAATNPPLPTHTA